MQTLLLHEMMALNCRRGGQDCAGSTLLQIVATRGEGGDARCVACSGGVPGECTARKAVRKRVRRKEKSRT